MGEYDIGRPYVVTYPEARALLPIMAHLTGRREHPDSTVAWQITTILQSGKLPPSMAREVKSTAGNVWMKLKDVREDVDYSDPLGGKQVFFDSKKAGELFEGWLQWADRQGLIEE